MLQKLMFFIFVCAMSSPAFAWVNQNDANWQQVSRHYNSYRQLVKNPKYNTDEAVQYLGNACHYIPQADMDNKTKNDLKGYFHYLAAQEYLKDGKKSKAETFLNTAKKLSPIVDAKNSLNKVLSDELKLSLATPKPVAESEKLTYEQAKQKNLQEVQNIMMGFEQPVQKTYIVEMEPRLKSKFVLTENAKNLSAEPIPYVSRKDEQQTETYQQQAYPKSTQTLQPAQSEKLTYEQTKQKNPQEFQNLKTGLEQPFQKTYIVETEPRLKSKFVLTENAKNLSAEPILYVSRKDEQQAETYQPQTYPQNTQTIQPAQTIQTAKANNTSEYAEQYQQDLSYLSKQDNPETVSKRKKGKKSKHPKEPKKERPKLTPEQKKEMWETSKKVFNSLLLLSDIALQSTNYFVKHDVTTALLKTTELLNQTSADIQNNTQKGAIERIVSIAESVDGLQARNRKKTVNTANGTGGSGATAVAQVESILHFRFGAQGVPIPNSQLQAQYGRCSYCGGSGMNPHQKEYWDSSLISAEADAGSHPTRCPICGDYSNHYHPNCPQCYGCGYNITPEQRAAINRIPKVNELVINRRNANLGDLMEESGIDLTPSNDTLGDMLKKNGIDVNSK